MSRFRFFRYSTILYLKRIDLRFPKGLKQYDKKSCKFFVDELKEYLSLGKRITEQKAIEFFENDDNFIL